MYAKPLLPQKGRKRRCPILLLQNLAASINNLLDTIVFYLVDHPVVFGVSAVVGLIIAISLWQLMIQDEADITETALYKIVKTAFQITKWVIVDNWSTTIRVIVCSLGISFVLTMLVGAAIYALN
jgi:hypothetical protein